MTDETMQSVFTFAVNEFLHPVRKMFYISLEMSPKTLLSYQQVTEAYLEPSRRSMKKHFAKIVKD